MDSLKLYWGCKHNLLRAYIYIAMMEGLLLLFVKRRHETRCFRVRENLRDCVRARTSILPFCVSHYYVGFFNFTSKTYFFNRNSSVWCLLIVSINLGYKTHSVPAHLDNVKKNLFFSACLCFFVLLWTTSCISRRLCFTWVSVLDRLWSDSYSSDSFIYEHQMLKHRDLSICFSPNKSHSLSFFFTHLSISLIFRQ